MARALEFIETQASSAPRISDLCKVSGASERTLRYAFRARFGMSPKSYLQAIRLNGLRRELHGAGPGAPVADVASRWGFWHIGQLAADYRRLFGELPSETLGIGQAEMTGGEQPLRRQHQDGLFGKRSL